MRRFSVIMMLLVMPNAFGTASRAVEPMSVETSWENVPRCVGRNGKNATMIIKNAPRGTKFINATLKFGEYELGGGRTPLREDGIVPEGAIHLMAPCIPGAYRWTIDAEDGDGHLLGTIQKSIALPSDG